MIFLSNQLLFSWVVTAYDALLLHVGYQREVYCHLWIIKQNGKQNFGWNVRFSLTSCSIRAKKENWMMCGWEVHVVMWFNGFMLRKESCSKAQVCNWKTHFPQHKIMNFKWWFAIWRSLKHPVSNNLLTMKVSWKFPTSQ